MPGDAPDSGWCDVANEHDVQKCDGWMYVFSSMIDRIDACPLSICLCGSCGELILFLDVKIFSD